MTAPDPADVRQAAELDALGSTNLWLAMIALFTSVERFANHDHAHLERSRRRAEIIRLPNTRPHSHSAAGNRIGAIESAQSVRKECFVTFSISLAVLMLALIGAKYWGAISPTLPLHWGKTLQTAGAAFALWGTLLALRGPSRRWGAGGNTAELVHAHVFTVILSVGGVLGMFGTLISF